MVVVGDCAVQFPIMGTYNNLLSLTCIALGGEGLRSNQRTQKEWHCTSLLSICTNSTKSLDRYAHQNKRNLLYNS